MPNIVLPELRTLVIKTRKGIIFPRSSLELRLRTDQPRWLKRRGWHVASLAALQRQARRKTWLGPSTGIISYLFLGRYVLWAQVDIWGDEGSKNSLTIFSYLLGP